MTSQWVLGRPAPGLRALIDAYVGYRTTAPVPAVHRGLPSRHLTLIASIGDPIDVVAARVVRFERATTMLRSPRRPALAEVAAACGYYDQSHFNRDFVSLAGCPPSEWLQVEYPVGDLPFVQDSDLPLPSDSVA